MTTFINNEVIISKVDDIKEEEEAKIKNAKDKIPEKYHDSLLLLSQNYLISDGIPQDVDDLPEGVYIEDGRTYIQTREPYLAVAGRNQWFVDSHKYEDGTRAKFYIKDNLDKITDILSEKGEIHPRIPVIVEVESELYGSARGEATVFWNGTGANETNPIENASTSALGRALAKLGFGIAGTGIASADELIEARKNRAPATNGEDKGNDNKNGSSKNKQSDKNKSKQGKQNEKNKKEDQDKGQEQNKNKEHENNKKEESQNKENTSEGSENKGKGSGSGGGKPVPVKLTADPPAELDEQNCWVLKAETKVKDKTINGTVVVHKDFASDSFIKNLVKDTVLIVRGKAQVDKDNEGNDIFQIIAQQINLKNNEEKEAAS